MLHTDLHAAGFVLDPEFQQFLQHENQEVINGFHAMIERVFPDNVELQVKVIEQHSSYRAGHGLFGRPMALAAAKSMQLCQTVSASACERNWSTFEFVHTKKRNRLSSKKVCSLT